MISTTEAVPAIEVRDLVKRYGDVPAVQGVSFSIRRGEIVGLLGPNGAGKTTILQTLLGTPDPKYPFALSLAPAGLPGARSVAEVNGSFFDPSSPRTAMQIVTVRLDPFEYQVRRGSKNAQARVSLAVVEQTDWRKAQALLR